MKRALLLRLTRATAAAALLFGANTAFSQETAPEAGRVAAPLPRTMASPIRITPVVGASSFSTANKVTLENFDEGLSAGVFGDFGSGAWTFETGVLTLGSRVDRAGDTASVNIDNWGIPLVAKLNFSGKPHETAFVKVGAMPFTTTGGIDEDINIMGVGGVGANLPLGRNSSVLIDASYNRMFTDGGDLTNYQGLSVLAGLSFNI